MPQYSKKAIAQQVKDNRITNGYTQQELADIARISLRSVQRIENGEVLPRSFTLKVLAEKLNFSLEDVIESPGAAKPGLNRTRKLILSGGCLVLLVLLTGAFLAQSSKFPETDFERLLLYAAIVGVYVLALFRIWK